MKIWTTKSGGWSFCQMGNYPHIQMTSQKQGGKNIIVLEGPRGKSELFLPQGFTLRQKKEKGISFRYYASRGSGAKHQKKLFLTFISLLKQKIKGITQSFTCQLQLVGVGYRAIIHSQKRILELRLGYSHSIEVPYEEDLYILCPNQRTIIIKGLDLPKVTQKAAAIRGWRMPEPYKGKGIFYKGESLQRKEGKKN